MQSIAVGAGVEGLFLLIFFRVHPVWRPPVSVSVVVLYLIALAWAWLPLRGSTDWAPHAAQGLLLVVAMLLLAAHDLRGRRGSGTPREQVDEPHQESKGLARTTCRLSRAAGGNWPARRDSRRGGPRAALLSDERPQVQATALGVLEHRPYWRPGEGEFVLQMGRTSEERPSASRRSMLLLA